MRGAIQTAHVEPIPEIDVLLQWADEVRELAIRANTDTATGNQGTRGNGAEIGYAAQNICFCRRTATINPQNDFG